MTNRQREPRLPRRWRRRQHDQARRLMRAARRQLQAERAAWMAEQQRQCDEFLHWFRAKLREMPPIRPPYWVF
jgi:hypothetical protein